MANTSETLAGSWLRERTFADCRLELDSQGFVVFQDVLDRDQIAGMRAALAPYLARDLTGRNDFEGERTHRVYALLAKSPLFADLATGGFAIAATLTGIHPQRTPCARAARTIVCALRIDAGLRPAFRRVTYQRSKSATFNWSRRTFQRCGRI